MKDLESLLKLRVENLNAILSEYEALNMATKCNYIESERELERELIVLEELLNNVDSSTRWRERLLRDRKNAGLVD